MVIDARRRYMGYGGDEDDVYLQFAIQQSLMQQPNTHDATPFDPELQV